MFCETGSHRAGRTFPVEGVLVESPHGHGRRRPGRHLIFGERQLAGEQVVQNRHRRPDVADGREVFPGGVLCGRLPDHLRACPHARDDRRLRRPLHHSGPSSHVNKAPYLRPGAQSMQRAVLPAYLDFVLVTQSMLSSRYYECHHHACWHRVMSGGVFASRRPGSTRSATVTSAAAI